VICFGKGVRAGGAVGARKLLAMCTDCYFSFLYGYASLHQKGLRLLGDAIGVCFGLLAMCVSAFA